MVSMNSAAAPKMPDLIHRAPRWTIGEMVKQAHRLFSCKVPTGYRGTRNGSAGACGPKLSEGSFAD